MTDMDRLWAPWRSAFLSQRKSKRACFLCTAARSRADRPHHVVARHGRAIALLNRYPYNNGHLLVAPSRHVGQFERVSSTEWADMLQTTQRLMRQVKRTLHPGGFNVGLNLGRTAGAGIPGHLHLHLVPRWHGDTNFFPLIAGTKVISQSLDELYTLLTSTGTPRR